MSNSGSPAAGDARDPVLLEGIALRRYLDRSQRNRVQKSVYIERELLDALGTHCDLNFEVNWALELKLTKMSKLRIGAVTDSER